MRKHGAGPIERTPLALSYHTGSCNLSRSMWINRDVDLPQALVSAQRDGRLVVAHDYRDVSTRQPLGLTDPLTRRKGGAPAGAPP